MNKQYTIIIIAIVAIIVGWVFLSGMSKSFIPTPTQEGTQNGAPSAQNGDGAQNQVPNVAVVSFNATGFSPESVAVKQGEKIIFVNLSDEPMWVASAFHPTHQLYPEFDSKGSVSLGGRYEFTFDKKGEWKYHNHMRPGLTGTVIVK